MRERTAKQNFWREGRYRKVGAAESKSGAAYLQSLLPCRAATARLELAQASKGWQPLAHCVAAWLVAALAAAKFEALWI